MAETAFDAFLSDATSRRLVGEVDRLAKVHRGTVRDAVRSCRSGRSPEVLLVDLDGEQNPIVHVATLLQVCRPETVILATGSENNVTLANDLYRGGIFLYLPKPLDAGNLQRALAEVDSVHDEEARPQIQTSRLLLVLGDGMGTNTVTVLLARLAAERGRYVTCIDLDRNFGSLALALDTPPQRGLIQALQRPDSGAMGVEQLQARVAPRIGLVAHPVDHVDPETSEEPGLPGLIDALSAQAHMILACGASPQQVAALRLLTTNHLLVFEPTPAGMSVAIRWMRILDGAASTLVLNHARPLPNLIGADQLSDGLGGRSPDLQIPYIKAMARAMALGEPEKALSRRERQALERFLQPLLGVGSVDEGS